MTGKTLYLIAVVLCMVVLRPFPATAGDPAKQADTLLKQATSRFLKDAAAGRATAAKALAFASAQHLPLQQVKALNLLAYFAFVGEQLAAGEAYARQAVQVSRGMGIDSLTGDALVTLGIIQAARQKFDQAIAVYQEAEKRYLKAGLSSRLALLYLDLGVAEKKAGRLAQANVFYFKAADIYTRAKDLSSLAEVYNDIGNCFTVSEDHQKGIAYFRRSLAIREQLHDTVAIAQSCNNIGYVLQLDSLANDALAYLSRAMRIREKLKDSSSLALTLQNMGSAWIIKNDPQKAAPLLLRSLKIARQYDMQEYLARGNLDFAELFLKQAHADSALRRVNTAEAIALKLGIPELSLKVFEIKLKILVSLAAFREAYAYTQKLNHIRDSLFTVAKNRTINELEVSFQTRERKRDIAALTLKNQLEHRVVRQQYWSIWMLATVGVLLLSLLIVLAVSYRSKNKANQRIQTLLQELHHRVKNNLQILSGLFAMQISSLDDETAKNALRENETRLTAMNLIHHKLYSGQDNNNIEMAEYLETLMRHIQASFGKGRLAQVQLVTTLDTMELAADKAVAIGLIVNELATNAFKYAFHGSHGTISLSLKRNGEQGAILYLADDGQGWAEPKGRQQSFGLEIIELMALQLHARLESDHTGPTWYRLSFTI